MCLYYQHMAWPRSLQYLLLSRNKIGVHQVLAKTFVIALFTNIILVLAKFWHFVLYQKIVYLLSDVFSANSVCGSSSWMSGSDLGGFSNSARS